MAPARDWTGWVWPVPIWEDRVPLITQEWKPGFDPTPGEASGETSNHLGVDIMFRKLATDDPESVVHDSQGPFISPEGTPIIAAGDGEIWATGEEAIYGKWIQIDHPGQGVETFYQHLASYEKPWQKGDPVSAGDIIGRMGYAPGDPGGLRHLHFELWFPVAGTPLNSWRLDPAPSMAQWAVISKSQIESVTSQAANALGAVKGIPVLPVIALGVFLYLWWD